MDMLLDDQPTLRMTPLRGLLANVPPPLLHDEDSPVAAVLEALMARPLAVALIVDRDGGLIGTLRLGDLAALEAQGRLVGCAADVAIRDTPVLDALEDATVARRALAESGVDRVLVIDHLGALVGVLTDVDLARAERQRPLGRGVRPSATNP